MSSNLLILHGLNGKAGIFWQDWLANKCRSDGWNVLMPSLPNPTNPARYEWLDYIIKTTSNIDLENTWIVAHSLGVPAGLDFLETLEDKNHLKGFISVAGFYKPYGQELNEKFMKTKTINIKQIKELVEQRFVIRSNNDPYVDQYALEELAKDFNANDFLINNGKHFHKDEYADSFPLLKCILDIYNLK